MQTPATPDNEHLRLDALRRITILDTSAEERFDRITRMARNMFDVPISLVSLVDKDRQWFKSCCGLPVLETPRDISFCGHAILGDGLFVVEDATRDLRFADNPLVTGDPHIRFYAGAPLSAPGGHHMELAQAAVDALGDHSCAALLANHGVIVGARDLDEGLVAAQVLELLVRLIAGHGFPWHTLFVNVAGSAIMGGLMVALAHKGGLRFAPFLMTGVLGGFTTFSAFSLEVANMLRSGETLKAGLYAGVSVLFSVSALFIGLWMARRIFA